MNARPREAWASVADHVDIPRLRALFYLGPRAGRIVTVRMDDERLDALAGLVVGDADRRQIS